MWENWELRFAVGGVDYEISAAVLAVFAVSFVTFLFILVRAKRWFGVVETGSCRWQRDRKGDRPPFRSWHCNVCAAHAFATGRYPPRECKKMLKTGL